MIIIETIVNFTLMQHLTNIMIIILSSMMFAIVKTYWIVEMLGHNISFKFVYIMFLRTMIYSFFLYMIIVTIAYVYYKGYIG